MKYLALLLMTSTLAFGAPKKDKKKKVTPKKKDVPALVNPCIGVLTYKITYWNGRTQHHRNRVTAKDRQYLEALLVKKSFIKENDIYRIENKKYTPKKPYDCNKEPPK